LLSGTPETYRGPVIRREADVSTHLAVCENAGKFDA
jgi:hypothetical protein